MMTIKSIKLLDSTVEHYFSIIIRILAASYRSRSAANVTTRKCALNDPVNTKISKLLQKLLNNILKMIFSNSEEDIIKIFL